MKRWLLALSLLFAFPAFAEQELVCMVGGRAVKCTGLTEFPTSPTTGDTVIITDDSAAGACDSAAGSAVSICRWDGSAWGAIGDGGGGSGDSVSIDGVAATDPDFTSDGSLDAIRCTGAGTPDASCGAAEDVIYRLQADSVDAITEIAAALKSGADGTLITGTAGTSGNCVEWNVDGDIVDAGAACGGGGGTPGGADGDLQYNNGGAFGGFGDFNDATQETTFPGQITGTRINATIDNGGAALESQLRNSGAAAGDDVLLTIRSGNHTAAEAFVHFRQENTGTDWSIGVDESDQFVLENAATLAGSPIVIANGSEVLLYPDGAEEYIRLQDSAAGDRVLVRNMANWEFGGSGGDPIVDIDLQNNVLEVSADGYLLPPQHTVSALPSCTTSLKGARATITDANAACTFAATPTGGGATVCPVYCDGAAWRQG